MTDARFVLDASIGIKLVLDEEYSSTVRDFLTASNKKRLPRLCVPDLFFIECANVLWKHSVRGAYSREESQRDIARLSRLKVSPMPMRALMQPALKISHEMAISVYDACYVAASEVMNAPLFTADKRLLAKLPANKYRVYHVEEMKP